MAHCRLRTVWFTQWGIHVLVGQYRRAKTRMAISSHIESLKSLQSFKCMQIVALKLQCKVSKFKTLPLVWQLALYAVVHYANKIGHYCLRASRTFVDVVVSLWVQSSI